MEKRTLNSPMKTFVLFFPFCFFMTFVLAKELPSKGDSMLLFDYSNVLDNQEQLSLEKKLQEKSISMGCNLLVILTRGKKYADSLAIHASKAKASDRLVIITADVASNTYGFFVSEQLQGRLPAWVREKIQDNFIKKNFKEKRYFDGLDQAVEMVSGIVTGEVNSDDLRKDASNSTILILFVVVVFFLIIFPILQYFRMRRNHFTAKPVDLVSSVLLTNTFGTRGKNLFDDFSRSSGKFSEESNSSSGAGGVGIEGSW